MWLLSFLSHLALDMSPLASSDKRNQASAVCLIKALVSFDPESIVLINHLPLRVAKKFLFICLVLSILADHFFKLLPEPYLVFAPSGV
jgi:hypothetical protein